MYGSIPKDTLAEILIYLAENEKFSSLKDFGTLSPTKLKNALQDLAQRLKQEASQEFSEEDIKKLEQSLKKPHQAILSKLSSEERERLLRGFLN